MWDGPAQGLTISESTLTKDARSQVDRTLRLYSARCGGRERDVQLQNTLHVPFPPSCRLNADVMKGACPDLPAFLLLLPSSSSSLLPPPLLFLLLISD